MKTKPIQFTVSKRAIVARISRKLAKEQRQFRATKSKKDRLILGEWCIMQGRQYVVDYNEHWKLEDWAKQFEVLASNEKIEN